MKSMMNSAIVVGYLLVSIFPLTLLASQKKSHQHEAHEHGAAELNIAFDQLIGRVEFKAAAAGLLGFEHEAKTDKDKKKLNTTILQFEKNIESMIKFENSIDCVFSKDQIQMALGDKKNHADFVASFDVICKKDLKGTSLTFDFTSFKDLNDIDVSLLIGSIQKHLEIKKRPITVELK